MHLYQVWEGKIITIQLSPFTTMAFPSVYTWTCRLMFTVVTEMHYGKLWVNCPLQQTSIAIRS